MRIQNLNRSNGVGRRKAGSPAKTSGSSASAGGAAAVVSIARGRASRVHDDVAARLEAVRSQLADNAYPIDFDRLAESIVDDEISRGLG